MARIRQPIFPSSFLPLLQKDNITLRQFTSPKAFEAVLLKFLKEQHVLHLCTSKDDVPRATPLEYRLHGLTFYILSEGGGKFNNLKVNKKVAFSIAAPYDSNKDFWGSRGVQAWGKAIVYSMKTNPRRFKDALKKMNAMKTMKKIGMKTLPAQFNYRVIEISPDQIIYSDLRAGVYHVSWTRK